MKLLGIEFQKFACFEKYFLPIQPGINLLVGRNNTGKTALLRGLNALKGLPIHPSSTIEDDLSGYVRDESNPPSFGLRVKFQLESNDPNIYYYDTLYSPSDWEKHIRKEEPILHFSLTLVPERQRISIEKAELTYVNRSLTVLAYDRQQGLMQSVCNFEGKV
ncbi:MAG: AAA family ATPase, partial [Acidobacteria bacterium]|nr:AAA family ATPase [Acidobacteriota bacterium]